MLGLTPKQMLLAVVVVAVVLTLAGVIGADVAQQFLTLGVRT